MLLDANESGQVQDILAQQPGRKVIKRGLVDIALLFRGSVLSACSQEKVSCFTACVKRTCRLQMRPMCLTLDPKAWTYCLKPCLL